MVYSTQIHFFVKLLIYLLSNYLSFKNNSIKYYLLPIVFLILDISNHTYTDV